MPQFNLHFNEAMRKKGLLLFHLFSALVFIVQSVFYDRKLEISALHFEAELNLSQEKLFWLSRGLSLLVTLKDSEVHGVSARLGDCANPLMPNRTSYWKAKGWEHDVKRAIEQKLNVSDEK